MVKKDTKAKVTSLVDFHRDVTKLRKEMDIADEVTPLSRFEYEPGTNDKPQGSLVTIHGKIFGEKELPLTEQGMRGLCSRLGIPYDFFMSDKLDDELRYAIANEIIHDEQKSMGIAPNIQLRSAVVDGSRVARAVMSEKYSPMDNLEVLDALLSGDFKEHKDAKVLRGTMVDHELMYLRISTGPEHTGLRGDLQSDGGWFVGNSEVGTRYLRILPLLWYMLCANVGIIVAMKKKAARKVHLGNAALVDVIVPALVAEGASGKEAFFGMYKAAAGIAVNRPLDFLANFGKASGFQKEIIEASQGAFSARKEYKDNVLGMYHSVTEGAQSHDDINKRVKVEERAANLLSARKSDITSWDRPLEEAA